MSDYISKQIVMKIINDREEDQRYWGKTNSVHAGIAEELKELASIVKDIKLIPPGPSGNTGELHRIMAVNQQLEIELVEAKAITELTIKENEKLKKWLQASRDSVYGISVESDEAKCEAREAKEIANLATKALEAIKVMEYVEGAATPEMRVAIRALDEIRRLTDARQG